MGKLFADGGVWYGSALFANYPFESLLTKMDQGIVSLFYFSFILKVYQPI